MVALADVRRRLSGIDFAATESTNPRGVEDLVGLVDDLECLAEEVAEVRCVRCGCSQMDACPGGCSWVSSDPALCSACVRPAMPANRRAR